MTDFKLNTRAAGSSTEGPTGISFDIRDANLWYTDFQALKNITMRIPSGQVTAFIGPSGCGKSTLLKSLNRMNDLIPGCRITGTFLLDGEDIYSPRMEVNMLRKRVGMVFQKPNPFPMSIYDNIAYGPRMHGTKGKAQLDEIVERSLTQAALWDEMKDNLKKSAMSISGGQQQRLCLARALALEPAMLLLDEPTASLDVHATEEIESLLLRLASEYPLLVVSHNPEQAVRLGERLVIMAEGRVQQVFERGQVDGEAVARALADAG